MRPTSGPRTPGYRFKDGKLIIFSEEEVMLIRGWDKPSAVAKAGEFWEPFVPEFRLVAPYRRSAKASTKKAVKPKAPPAEASQMDFGLFDAPNGKEAELSQTTVAGRAAEERF